MLKIGKEFIKFEELKSQKMTSDLLELKSLRKRKLKNFYLKEHSRIIKECDSKIILESDFFLEYFLIHKDRSLLEENFTRNIPEIVSLFNYFLYEFGTFNDNEIFVNWNHNESGNANFLSIFFKSINFKKFLILLEEGFLSQKDKDLIEYFIYYVMISQNLWDNKNDEYFDSFEKSFNKVKKYLDKNLKLVSYELILNYYGHDLNYPKLYVVFKNLLNENIFEEYPGFQMPPMIFRNIFINFLRINPDEALEFIEKYKNYLNPEISQSFYNFCKAEIEIMIEKNFEKALDYIKKIEISSFILKYDIRNQLLIIYYSLNYFEEAYCLIQTYRKFLRGNENVPDHMEKSILKFLHFYEKLFNLKISNNIPEKKRLKDEIEKVPLNSIWFKPWLSTEISKLLI